MKVKLVHSGKHCDNVQEGFPEEKLRPKKTFEYLELDGIL